MRTLSILLLFFLTSCAATRHFDPAKKFSPQAMQEDYRIFRNVLEESHPSLYWYTPKDSVDRYFAIGEAKLKDSLPEYKFRLVLSYVLSKIHCGHTTVRASKASTQYSQRTRSFLFPLSVKAWDDTVVITSNLSRRDSTVARGSLLTAIDGRPIRKIVDTLFQHLSADGYNTTHKYQTLSNPGVFRSLYGSVYGLRSRTPVSFIDTNGLAQTSSVALYLPTVDSNRLKEPQPSKAERKRMERESMRNMKIDTALNTAILEVNTFSKGYRLRSFFRKSFRTIERKKIDNVVVDMRGNGGGNVTLSNLLTSYLADKPFKIADSLYAVSNKSRYHRYQSGYFLNRLFFIFLTRKKSDGHYHFKYFEGRYFKPKKRHHFEGTSYIMTGGNTFSAAALFTKALIDQKDVVVVGEETGGGAYGNTAWLIPDVTLPNTRVRFRLPLFRLVIDTNEVKGRGIIPEVPAPPTLQAIRRNEDYKMDAVRGRIEQMNKEQGTRN